MAFKTIGSTLIVTLLCTALHADIIHLKNGKSLQGEVVKEDDTTVVLKVPSGEITLRASDVDYIEHQTPQEYQLDLGGKLLQENRFDDALKAFEKVYESDKKNDSARHALANAYALQGKHLLELKRFAEAQESFEKLQKLDPNSDLAGQQPAKALKEIEEQQKHVNVVISLARELADHDINRAIKAFEHAISLTPDALSIVSTELAQCHVRRAAQYRAANGLMNAAADLEAALQLDPRLADAVEHLYVVCALPGIVDNLRTGNLGAAETDLKRVMGFAPSNKNVLYVQGRLQESLGHTPEAADAYALGLRRRVENATPQVVAEFRQQLETELGIQGQSWKIEVGFVELERFANSSDGPAKTLESENFQIIHYNDDLAQAVSEAAELQRQQITSALKLPGWHGKVKIYLYRTQAEYTAHTAQPEWTGGVSTYGHGGTFSDPQIHSWQTSPRLLKSVLPHEITHLVVAANLSDPLALPRCLHEGFAILMEPKFRQDHFMNLIQFRLKSQEFMPLPDLLAARSYPKDPEVFYAESYALLKYLSDSKGLDSVVSLVRNTTSLSAVQPELLEISGAHSLEDLDTAWREWMTAQKNSLGGTGTEQ